MKTEYFVNFKRSDQTPIMSDLWIYDTSGYGINTTDPQDVDKRLSEERERREERERQRERERIQSIRDEASRAAAEAEAQKQAIEAEKQRVADEERRARIDAKREEAAEQQRIERQKAEQERIRQEAARLAEVQRQREMDAVRQAEARAEREKRDQEDMERLKTYAGDFGKLNFPLPSHAQLIWYQQQDLKNLDLAHGTDVQDLFYQHIFLSNGACPDADQGARLELAVENAHLDMITLLREHGGNLDIHGGSALKAAAARNDKNTFIHLLKSGAKLEAVESPSQSVARRIFEWTGHSAECWKPQNQEKIMKRDFEQDEDEIYTVRTVFNFKARRIELHKTLDQTAAMAMIPFQLCDNLEELAEAHKQLTLAYPDTKPLEHYLSSGLGPRRPSRTKRPEPPPSVG